MANNNVPMDMASFPGEKQKPKPMPKRKGNVNKIKPEQYKHVVTPTGELVKANQGSILVQILSFVKRLQFATESDEGIKQPTQKDFIVKTVKEILNIVKRNNFGLLSYNDQIYAYKEQFWKVISKQDLAKFLSEAAKKMGVDETMAEEKGFCRKLVDQFHFTASLQQPNLAGKDTLINLKNGTFEITAEGSRLREFRKEDFLTYQLPFDYDPKAEAPQFTKYLNKVLPEKELQRALAEFMGYVFAKDLKLEKCLLLYGSGANGKSVFFDIMNALLGRNNISNFSLSNLNHPYSRAQIADKLLNYGSEINNSKIAGDLLKQLASGEKVEARQPHGRPFMISKYAKLCFNCNALPSNPEQTEAYFRRFLIIPFQVTIPEGERDAKLAEKIITAELSGVFNWVLNGLKSLLKNQRFTESKMISEVVKDYKEDSDSVLQFITEKGHKPSKEAKVRFSVIYESYRKYCSDNGFRPLERKPFSNKMKDHKLESRKGTGNVPFFFLETDLKNL